MFNCNSSSWDGTVASPPMEIWMHPHLCATQLAAFTCRLWPNPLMGLQHSTHFSYRGTVTAKHHRRRESAAFMRGCPSSFRHRSIHNEIWDFLSKTTAATGKKSLFSYNVDSSRLLERNQMLHQVHIHCQHPESPFSCPPTTTTSLSFSTIKYFSRWFGFNNSRSWWGHSCRANTGTGSSICLWMGNTYPIPPPDTSSWRAGGGAQSHQKE